MAKSIDDLRDCVDLLLQKNEPSTDIDGEDDEFYQTIILQRYADLVRINRGAAFHTTRNIDDAATHKIWIRHDEDIDDTGFVDHAVIRGRIFRILNMVIDEELDVFLIMEVRELGKVPADEFDIRPIVP